MSLGRQTEYTAEKADAICERLAEGESLRSICRDDAMPAQSTVFKWLIEQTAFSEQYARAREAQADALFDEALDIADDGTNDWKMRKNGDGDQEAVVNTDHIQRSRLRVETRKWMVGKLAPKKYGEKIDHNVGGAVTINVVKRGGE